jgi:hypothetical protein
MYIHMVWFEGRTDPERVVLADRKLYDEYTQWLKDHQSVKGGWAYEHHEGAHTVLNFQKVTHMTVRPQPDFKGGGEDVAPPSGEQTLR